MKRILLFLLTLSSFGMPLLGGAVAELSPEAQQLLDTAKIAQTEARQSNPKGNIDQAAWRKAVDAAEAAVTAAPREAATLRLRAQVYTEIKFWVRAESSWRALFNSTQDNETAEDRAGMSETLFNLGYNQYQSGDLEGAFKRFAEASVNTPEAARNEIWQGRILLERGDARGALPHWDRAVKLEPANATSKYFLLISQKSANYGEAAVSAFTLGYKAFEAKKYDEALVNFNKAFEYKDRPEYLYLIGQVYDLQEQTAKAIDNYTKYIEITGGEGKYESLARVRIEYLKTRLGEGEK